MANESLQRTPTSTGNRKVWTWSGWVKRNQLSSTNALFSQGVDDDNSTQFRFDSGNTFRYEHADVSSPTDALVSSNVFRDVSNWCHFVVSVDTTQEVESNRIQIYFNGDRQTNLGTANYPTINFDTDINTLTAFKLGALASSGNYHKGELADVFFIDGQALTPDVFGFYKEGKGYISAGSTQATDFRPGQWVPKTPRVIKTEINRRGGFGVNGFYLPMNDSSNFGADFHCEPNSIIKLQEDLPQPKVSIASTAQAGLAYTDVLRADPYAANLLVACPFVSGGLGTDGTVSATIPGLGDYHRVLGGQSNAPINFAAGSGTQATVAIGTGVYYGSSLGVTTSTIRPRATVGTALTIAGDYTVEFWAYLNSFAADGTHLVQYDTDAGATGWAITHDEGKGRFLLRDSGGTNYEIQTTVGVATVGQWNHWAGVYERNKNRITLYVNGVAVGINTNVRSDYPSAQYSGLNRLHIGSNNGDGSRPMLGYMQDLRIYNTAKYKGGFDVPKPYTPVGIATWRAVPDCTANNFATMNSVVNSSNGTNESFSNGNLTVANGEFYISTVGLTTGKWYWEYYESAYTNYAGYGIDGHAGSATTFASRTQLPGAPSGGQLYIAPGRSTGAQAFRGTVYNTSETINITHPTITLPITSAGTVYAVALDLDSAQGIGSTGAVHFYINGTRIDQQLALPTIYQGISTTGNVVTPFTYAAGTQNLNFGQNPTFSGQLTAGTFTDSNGKGLFKYQPPSGFLALCEDNLPTPAISDPGDYFKTVLYTGTGTSRNIVGVGFTPDLVWVKGRNTTARNRLFNSISGPGRELYSDLTNAEAVDTGGIQSFDNDGFSLGTNDSNTSGTTMVAWCWRAGAGTTSTNTNGSITSVVSVNQDAGFSIVSYNGNLTGSGTATVGHGLGKNPAMIITKARNTTSDWIVMHKSLPTWSHQVYLHLTDASVNSSSTGTRTVSTSTFTTNYVTGINVNGNSYIAYCWAEIEGFSKFGSYVGNGNADGPMVWCGFRPAFVLCKTVNTSNSWVLGDSSRGSTNPSMGWLVAHSSDAEYTTGGEIDYLSNGFKIRNGAGNRNTSGETYIFAAFAESPFTTANAK